MWAWAHTRMSSWRCVGAVTLPMCMAVCCSELQAPSPALSAYIKSGCVERSSVGGERMAFELQDNYIILQNCAREALDLSDQLHQVAEAASGEALDPVGSGLPGVVAQAAALGEALNLNGQLGLAAGETSEAAMPQPIEKACGIGASAEDSLCAGALSENRRGGGGRGGGARDHTGDGGGGSDSIRGEVPVNADVSCQEDETGGAWVRPSDLEVALMMTCMAEAVAKESEIMVSSAPLLSDHCISGGACHASRCMKPLGPRPLPRCQHPGPFLGFAVAMGLKLSPPSLSLPPLLLSPQVRIAAAIKVDTPPAEMFTYVQTWRLAPFLDDGLRDSLMALKCDLSDAESGGH